MPPIKQTRRLTATFEKALKNYNAIYDAERDERKQAQNDRRFCSVAGAQWEGPLSEQYENRAKFEVNKVFSSCLRIENEYRNNRITVDFTPKDDQGDKMADDLDGLYRADEQDSDAQESYDNAFNEASKGGYGAWRLCHDYEDDTDEYDDRQRIRFEPIYDAETSVYFDGAAKRQDKRDAKYCYVVSSMPTSDFIEEYDEDPTTWPKMDIEEVYDWSNEDLTYIAEYYEKEESKETIRIFETITGDEKRYSEKDFEDDPMLEDMLIATGAKELDSKKIKKCKVHKYIMSGGGILEDCGYIAGPNLPVIMVYGIRTIIDSIERVMGHVRFAKDAQRLKNMQLSKLGELSATTSQEKPIFTNEQIAGYEQEWADDPIENYAVLRVNQIKGPDGEIMPSGPMGYTKPPAMPPAMAALLAITEEDMRDILGNSQMTEEMNAPISGKAVQLLQGRMDMMSFIYMSNFAKGMKRCGEVWLGMAKELYVEEGRKMKAVNKDGKARMIDINSPSMSEEGEPIYDNDMTSASFDVNVEVGPSSSSKRAATVQAVTGMKAGTTDPETIAVLDAVAMMNMEGEGVSGVREYFRKKLVRMGASEPTEEDKEMMAMESQQKDANSQYLESAAQKEEAEAANYRAKTMETIANASLKEAQKLETEIETAIKADEAGLNMQLKAKDLMTP